MKPFFRGRPSFAAVFFLLVLAGAFRTFGAEVEFDLLLGRSIPADGKGKVLYYEEWIPAHSRDPAATEVFRRLFELEGDAPHLLETAVRFFDALGNPSPADLLNRTAHLGEMLGKTDLAQDLYLRAYGSSALPEALFSSICLLAEMGEGERVLELAGLPHAAEGRAAAVLPYLTASGTEDPARRVPAASTEPATRLAAAFLSYAYFRDRGETAPAEQALALLGREFPRSPEFALSRTASRVRIASTPGSFLQRAASAQGRPSAEAVRRDLAVQTGSFGVRENAEDMVKELRRIGYAPTIREIVRNGKKYFAVMAAMGLALEEGQAVIDALKEKNVEGFLRLDPGD